MKTFKELREQGWRKNKLPRWEILRRKKEAQEQARAKEYDLGKVMRIRADQAKATPEFTRMEKAALDAAIEAGRKGTEYLRVHGGFTKTGRC